jgi:hypothetical protein
MTSYETLRPTSSGVVVQNRPSGTPSMVAEVRADGMVLAARALKVMSQANTGTSGGMERNVAQTSVRFVEVAELLVNAAGLRGLVSRPGWADRGGSSGGELN